VRLKYLKQFRRCPRNGKGVDCTHATGASREGVQPQNPSPETGLIRNSIHTLRGGRRDYI